MIAKYFLSGMLLGGLSIFLLMTMINNRKSPVEVLVNKKAKHNSWNWPDSLDALVAASDFHKLISETDDFRVLEVTVRPGQLDPIHTHKGKSIVWVVQSSPILYNTYGMGSDNTLALLKQDTINIKTEELNIGNWENPEPPHSVQNIGNEIFKLYRIEFKNAMR